MESVNATVALGFSGEPAIILLIKLFLDPGGNVLDLASLASAESLHQPSNPQSEHS